MGPGGESEFVICHTSQVSDVPEHGLTLRCRSSANPARTVPRWQAQAQVQTEGAHSHSPLILSSLSLLLLTTLSSSSPQHRLHQRRLCSLLRPSTNLTTFGSHSSSPFAYSISLLFFAHPHFLFRYSTFCSSFPSTRNGFLESSSARRWWCGQDRPGCAGRCRACFRQRALQRPNHTPSIVHTELFRW